VSWTLGSFAIDVSSWAVLDNLLVVMPAQAGTQLNERVLLPLTGFPPARE